MPITGQPILAARSMILHIFSAITSPSEPPKTVKSWREDAHAAAVDRAVAGDDGVAPGPVLLHVELVGAVAHEGVELLEGAGVEQLLDPLAGGELALGVLLLDRLLGGGVDRGLAQLLELGELLLVGLGGVLAPWRRRSLVRPGRVRGQPREKGRWCADPRSSSTPTRTASTRASSKGSGAGSTTATGSGRGRAQPRRAGAPRRPRRSRAPRRPRRSRAPAPARSSGTATGAARRAEAARRATGWASGGGSGTGSGSVRLGLGLHRGHDLGLGLGFGLRLRAHRLGLHRRGGDRHLRPPTRGLELHRAACAVALPDDGGLGLELRDADLAELAEMPRQRADVADLGPQLGRGLHQGALCLDRRHRWTDSPVGGGLLFKACCARSRPPQPRPRGRRAASRARSPIRTSALTSSAATLQAGLGRHQEDWR